jgi:hypothetical protein
MHWFRPVGPLFVPVSIPGLLITLACAAFCLQVFLFVDARSHSASDTFYGVFPYWTPTFLLWAWLAERTSRSRP